MPSPLPVPLLRAVSAGIICAASLACAAPALAADGFGNLAQSCSVAAKGASSAFEETGQTIKPTLSYSATYPTSTDHSQFRVALVDGRLGFSDADLAVLAPSGLELSGGRVTRFDLNVKGGTPAVAPWAAAPIAMRPGTLQRQFGVSGLQFPYLSKPSSGYIIRSGDSGEFTVVDVGDLTAELDLAQVVGGPTTTVRLTCHTIPGDDNWPRLGVIGANGTGGNRPTIIELSPSTGPTTGGTVVRATISNRTPDFQQTPTVTIGDQTIKAFTWIGPTVQFTMPPRPAGAAQVTIGWRDGATSIDNGGVDDFTFVAPPAPTAALPVLTRVMPKGGSAQLGGIVVISGRGLQGATAVRFGRVPATNFRVSGNSIIAFAPPQAPGGYPVIVTTPSGTSRSVGAPRYAYFSTS